MTASACRTCQTPLPEVGVGPGRHPKFCSEACKRAREYELRRLDGRINRVEDRLTEVRVSKVPSLDDAALLEKELDRLKVRLLQLLDEAA